MRNTQTRHLWIAFVGAVLIGSLATGQTPAPPLSGTPQGGTPSLAEAHLQANGSLVGEVAFPTEPGAAPTLFSSGQVSLVQNGQVVATAQIEPNGSFTFPSVQPGVYSVVAQGATMLGGTPVTGVGLLSVNVLPFDPALAPGSLAFQVGLIPVTDASMLASLQGAGTPVPGGGAGGAPGGGMGGLGGLMGAMLGGLGGGLAPGGGAGGGGGGAVSVSTPK